MMMRGLRRESRPSRSLHAPPYRALVPKLLHSVHMACAIYNHITSSSCSPVSSGTFPAPKPIRVRPACKYHDTSNTWPCEKIPIPFSRELTPRHRSVKNNQPCVIVIERHRSYLWCEVEPQVAVVRERILYEQRHLVRQAKPDPAGQATSLAEVGKVLEGESEGNWLGKLDADIVVWLVDVAVAAKGNGAGANVAIARELDTLLCALNGYYSSISVDLQLSECNSYRTQRAPSDPS